MPPEAQAKLARPLREFGRHVFVYSHLHTGQTVYSLNRVLNVTASIKQLAFAGKKTIPSGIRKDLWRPLLSVSFPTGPQGLEAFRKLREYRKLHEVAWDTTTPLARSGLLDLENPYVRQDTTRPPRKERSRIIMNQRANSIADLAAVLKEQDAAGQVQEQANAERKEAQDRQAREELVQLAQEEKDGGLPRLEKSIQDKEAQIAKLKDLHAQGDTGAPKSRTIKNQTHALHAFLLRKKKMIAARDAFNEGKAQLAAKGASSDSDASSLQMTIDPPPVFYPRPLNPKHIPKRGRLRKTLLAKDGHPAFTADGVVIRWSNPLDAEFAESWPPDVQHQDAGMMRHVHNKPDAEPILDAERILRSPKALWEMQQRGNGTWDRPYEELELLSEDDGSAQAGVAGQPGA